MLITIIIPLYNLEKYIAECLDSILEENMRDVEVIIMDDGSTDGSYEVIKPYLSRENVKYFYQENSGVAKTRNSGLLKAQGEYIMFIDADDYIKKGTLNILQEKISKYKPDCILYGHEMFDENGKTETRELDYLEENKIYTSNEIMKYILNLKLRGYIWDKVVRRSIWIENNIKFDDRKYCEDWYPTVKCIENSKSIISIKSALYGYRQHSQSAMHTKNMELVRGYSKAVIQILDSLNGETEEKSKIAFKGNTFGEIISGYNENYSGENMYSDFKKEKLFNIQMGDVFKILVNKDVALRHKISIVFWKLKMYGFIKKHLLKK